MGPKKMGPNKVGFEECLGQKKFESKKFVGPKEYLVPKNIRSKMLWDQQNKFGYIKM